MVTAIVFWFLFLLMFYSYILFPAIIKIISKMQNQVNNETATEINITPQISIIIAAYNEQSHIGSKILNILQSDFPAEKMEIIVGSDGSNDSTNNIILELAKKHHRIKPLLFAERRGKSAVLNDCVALSTGEFLVLTDAKVTFNAETIKNLLKNFSTPQIGIAGAAIINKNATCQSVAKQESAFMAQEIEVKYHEGKAFGSTIGVYGACYAIRRELYTRVPENFSVDDFFISLKVLQKGFKVILDKKSICYENVTTNLSEEFRRKVRIGVGNIQNLGVFSNMIFKFNGIGFCFLSHKVIRWYGPFILLAMLVISFYLWLSGLVYKILLIIQLVSIFASIADFYLRKIKLQLIILRFVTHFYTMNLALLVGFIKYMIGVKANVWEPTKR